MVLYGPNLSLMFLIHFFSYVGVYLAGVQCTSFSNFILSLYFAFWFQINQYFR